MKQEEYIKKHNLDEIDSFLFREFGIMGGACSAQKASEYHTARMVAEKLWEKEEPTGADFDIEWENYFKYKGDMATVNIKDLARHFVNWQKEQMMKDAIEGVIDIRKWPAKAQVEFYDKLPVFNISTGDKVKIIIIKED